jgi:putative flippase GtrA
LLRSTPLESSPMIQFIMFALVGCAAAVGHYAVLIALSELADFPPVAASVAGFAVGAVISYILNYTHVFKSDGKHAATFSRFIAVALVGMGLNTAVMWLLAHELDLHYLPAQLVATVVVMGWSYTANRFWTFAPATA